MPIASAAPVVYEDNPIYPNLVGRIDHIAQMGTLVTNFTLIKPGALHRANGGYLVLDALKVLDAALRLGRDSSAPCAPVRYASNRWARSTAWSAPSRWSRSRCPSRSRWCWSGNRGSITC